MKLYLKYKGYIVTCLIISIAVGIISFTKPGDTQISNELITARLYLPDANNGFYRGVRFDWSGIVASLDCNGHSYYGEWFINPYNPTNNDAVTGPAESFDALGYEIAKPGGSFVKIGVGALAKPDSSPYKFSRLYTITDAGKWKVKKNADRVQFTHILNDTTYSYNYQKTVQLVKGKPILILSHTLKNTGKRTIETSVFDHNFLMMDKQLTGPGLVVTFPFDVSDRANRRPDLVKLEDNQIVYLKELDKSLVSFTDLTNGKGCDKYDIKVENHNTGAAVHITADKPVAKIAYWSTNKTVCPEPYINIKVEPGQEFSWTISYEYYTCIIDKQPLQTNKYDH